MMITCNFIIFVQVCGAMLFVVVAILFFNCEIPCN
jgi:hypothetical protein